MPLKMVYDHILIKKTEAKNPQGIFLPAPADPAAPRYAEVLSIGPGRPSDYTGALIPMPDIQVGGLILMHGNEGIRITSEGEQVYAITPRAIIATKVEA